MSLKSPEGFAAPMQATILKDESVKLSKEKALEILSLDTFEGERNVNPRHVQTLFNAWTTGHFRWEHVVLGLAECEGKLYRLNGQHTCWLRDNIQDGDDPVVRCITYKVKNQTQLRSLYGTWDRNKSRTYFQVLKANLVGIPITRDVWPSILGHLGSGMRLWLYSRDQARNLTPEDLVSIINEKHPVLFRKVALYLENKYDVYHPIRRRAVVAAIFATFDANSKKAAEFWNAITEALGFKGKSDPRWQLRRWLDTQEMGRRNWGADERIFCTCILLWNKWRRGEKTEHVKPSDTRLKPI